VLYSVGREQPRHHW